MLQSDANCSPRSDSLLNREKTGNFAILGPDRDECTPKGSGSTRPFSANSLRNGTGNFKKRTGNSFGRSENFQGRAGNLSARTPCNRRRDSFPRFRQSCGDRKDRSVVQVHNDGRCNPRDLDMRGDDLSGWPRAYDTASLSNCHKHLNRLRAGPFSPWLCRGRRVGTRLSATASRVRQA